MMHLKLSRNLKFPQCSTWIQGTVEVENLTVGFYSPCTVYSEEGQELILIASLTEFFILESFCSGSDCTWTIRVRANHQMLPSDANLRDSKGRFK